VGRFDEKLKSIKIKSLGGISPSAENIRQVEEEVGTKLPPAYLALISDHGCWYTPWGYTRFSFRQHGREMGMLNAFFGVMMSGSYDIAKNYKMYKGRMPVGLLPIANDPGGNIICLSTAGDDKGSVYFWDHEEERPGLGPSYSNLYPLSGSLEEFIDTLEFEQLQDEEE
jgi:hypothetical protein